MIIQERVGCGHPDKICDFIAIVVKNFILNKDAEGRTAIEVAAFNENEHSIINIFGEYYCKKFFTNDELKTVIVKKLKKLLAPEYFNYLNINLKIQLAKQSPEIYKLSKKGAGDQGIITYGYHNQREDFYKQTVVLTNFLNAEKKIGRDWKFIVLKNEKIIFLNIHLPPYLDFNRPFLIKKIKTFILKIFQNYQVAIKFYRKGSILSDSGLTGRKIFCDFPFGYAWGGGAVWGKDNSKIDHSGLLYLRQFTAELYNFLKHDVVITLVYNIGVSAPISGELVVSNKVFKLGKVQLESFAVFKLKRYLDENFIKFEAFNFCNKLSTVLFKNRV